MGRVRTWRDPETWWAIVQRQAESGLSQVAFCAAEGLGVGSLQYWKRKFIREGRLPEARPAPATPWFAALAVDGSAVDPAAPAWQIELELGGGLVLRIHRAGGC
jgi:hypothetical protein